MTRLDSVDRRNRIHNAADRLNLLASAGDPSDLATQIAQRMVDGWLEIEANWTPRELGFDETPEERAHYQECFAALGEAIANFGDLFLVETI